MPADSIWNTPNVSPLASISLVFGSLSGSPMRSMSMPCVCLITSHALPRIVRFVRPRKSIFSRPSSATSHMPNCVVGSASASPEEGRCSGMMFTSGSGAITTPAACVLAWRATPSSSRAVSISLATAGSLDRPA